MGFYFSAMNSVGRAVRLTDVEVEVGVSGSKLVPRNALVLTSVAILRVLRNNKKHRLQKFHLTLKVNKQNVGKRSE